MHVEPLSVRHIVEILPTLRCPTKTYGMHPFDFMGTVLVQSIDPRAIILNDAPVILFGASVQSFFSRRASIWGFVSENVKKSPVAVARLSRRLMDEYLELYEELEATAEESSPIANRWVQWMGFHEIPSREEGFKFYQRERS